MQARSGAHAAERVVSLLSCHFCACERAGNRRSFAVAQGAAPRTTGWEGAAPPALERPVLGLDVDGAEVDELAGRGLVATVNESIPIGRLSMARLCAQDRPPAPVDDLAISVILTFLPSCL